MANKKCPLGGDGTQDCYGCTYPCYKNKKKKPTQRMSPYERTRAAVYATGNRWAIENFNATHN
jgi:hypothetical protein